MTGVGGDPTRPGLVTSAEAAKILGVALASVVRYAQSGYLPAVRRGRQGRQTWLFRRDVVERLATRRRLAQAWLNWVVPQPEVLAAFAGGAQ